MSRGNNFVEEEPDEEDLERDRFAAWRQILDTPLQHGRSLPVVADEAVRKSEETKDNLLYPSEDDRLARGISCQLQGYHARCHILSLPRSVLSYMDSDDAVKSTTQQIMQGCDQAGTTAIFNKADFSFHDIRDIPVNFPSKTTKSRKTDVHYSHLGSEGRNFWCIYVILYWDVREKSQRTVGRTYIYCGKTTNFDGRVESYGSYHFAKLSYTVHAECRRQARNYRMIPICTMFSGNKDPLKVAEQTFVDLLDTTTERKYMRDEAASYLETRKLARERSNWVGGVSRGSFQVDGGLNVSHPMTEIDRPERAPKEAVHRVRENAAHVEPTVEEWGRSGRPYAIRLGSSYISVMPADAESTPSAQVEVDTDRIPALEGVEVTERIPEPISTPSSPGTNTSFILIPEIIESASGSVSDLVVQPTTTNTAAKSDSSLSSPWPNLSHITKPHTILTVPTTIACHEVHYRVGPHRSTNTRINFFSNVKDVSRQQTWSRSITRSRLAPQRLQRKPSWGPAVRSCLKIMSRLLRG